MAESVMLDCMMHQEARDALSLFSISKGDDVRSTMSLLVWKRCVMHMPWSVIRSSFFHQEHATEWYWHIWSMCFLAHAQNPSSGNAARQLIHAVVQTHGTSDPSIAKMMDALWTPGPMRDAWSRCCPHAMTQVSLLSLCLFFSEWAEQDTEWMEPVFPGLLDLCISSFHPGACPFLSAPAALMASLFREAPLHVYTKRLHALFEQFMRHVCTQLEQGPSDDFWGMVDAMVDVVSVSDPDHLPLFQPLWTLCIQVVESDLPSFIRARMLYVLNVILEMQPHLVTAHPSTGLLCFAFDHCAESDDHQEASNVALESSSMLDRLAMLLPSNESLAVLLPRMQTAYASSALVAKRATMWSLAVLVEGCRDHLLEHADVWMPLLRKAMGDVHPQVCSAACVALYHLSTEFEEELRPFEEGLFHALLSMAKQVWLHYPDRASLEDVQHVLAAMEPFCVVLDPAHMQHRMDHIYAWLQPLLHVEGTCDRAWALLASLCNHCGGVFLEPMMDDLAPILLAHLDQITQLGKQRGQAVQAAAALCASLLNESLDPSIGRKLDAWSLDPQGLIKRCCTMLSRDVCAAHALRALATLLESLPAPMLSSVCSSVLTYAQQRETEAQGEMGTRGTSEEEEACIRTLTVLIQYDPSGCLAHADALEARLVGALHYGTEHVRMDAIEGLESLVLSVYTPTEQWTLLRSKLDAWVPLLCTRIQEDPDVEVCVAALDCLNAWLDALLPASDLLGWGDPPRLDALSKTLDGIWNASSRCIDQWMQEHDPWEVLGEMALHARARDLCLTLCAYWMDVQPALCTLWIQQCIPSTIHQYFEQPRTSDHHEVYLGLWAMLLDITGPHMMPFASVLLPVLVEALTQEEEIQRNAVFALGLLAALGDASMASSILLMITPLFSDTSRVVQENVMGSICRIYLSHPTLVSMQEWMPRMHPLLPCTEDVEPNHVIQAAFERAND